MAIRVSRIKRKKFARRVKRRTVSKKIKNYIARAISSKKETKFVTSNNSAITVGNNAANGSYVSFPTASVSQGVGRNARVGDRMKWTYIKGQFTAGVPPGAGPTKIRLLLLWIKDTSLTSTASIETELMDNGAISPFTLCFLYNKTGIRVLYDRVYYIGLNQPTTVANDANMGLIKFSRRLNITQQYGPGGTTGDNGYLAVYMVSDQTTGMRPSLQGAWRAYFKDDD